MKKRKVIERTPAAEAIYQDFVDRAYQETKTIMVRGEEVTVPVTVLPQYDPRLLLAKNPGVPAHDALNVVATGGVAPNKRGA